MVLARDHISLVDLHVSARERSFGIATPRFLRRNRLGSGNVGGGFFRRVSDAHERGRVDGLLECVGDHKGDRLALMAHPVILEHVQAFTDVRIDEGPVRAIGEPRRVAVR